MLPTLNPWLLLVSLIAFIAVGSGAYIYGNRSGHEAERLVWSEQLSRQSAEASKALADETQRVLEAERLGRQRTAELEAQLAARKKEVQNAYDKARRDIAAAGGLRERPEATSGGGGDSTQAGANTTTGTAAAIRAGSLSERASVNLVALMQEADDLNEAYRACLDALAAR
jgi:hypothetical protein